MFSFYIIFALSMEKFTIKSPVDSLPLSCLLTEPMARTHPKAIFQLSHGMCEHKERYIPFMEFLSDNGYICIINDHRGHGASVKTADDLGFLGKDGHLALVEDTKAVTDYVKARYPGAKLHMLGHSMGSMVVRSFAKRYDDCIDTLFVSGSPSDNPMKGIGKFLAAAFGTFRGWHYRPDLLQKMSFGTYNKPFANEKYKCAWVCSDEEVLKEYHSDPLCQYVFTADGFYNMTALMQDCYNAKGWAMKNPELPVHFLSGAQDPCRTNDNALCKAVDLMKNVGYTNTDLTTYPGMRHEILNETDKLQVWNHVLHSIA